MSLYVLLRDGAASRYPYSPTDLRRDNPGTSFPSEISDALLAEWGVCSVTPTTPPAYDPITQTLHEDTPIQVDGQWVQVWEVRAASAAEVEQRKQQIRDAITGRVQERLDSFAGTRGYDNIASACSYATSTHPKYGPEGRYCVQAREKTWDTLFAIEADVIAGERPMPRSYEDIEPELPALVWPE